MILICSTAGTNAITVLGNKQTGKETTMWYGKGFNDGPQESDIESRLKKLEERERQAKRDENFSMTASLGGGYKHEDTNRETA